MPRTGLPTGVSDRVSFDCTCGSTSSSTSTSLTPSRSSGLVLLFYRYFDAPPRLPDVHSTLRANPTELSKFHTTRTTALNLGGKVRVSHEGFNITVGGTAESINAYISACTSHWSFADLSLGTDEERKAFFKPTLNGCSCVFGPEFSPASVRITDEITPMGVTGYVPLDWEGIEVLEPREYHERLWNVNSERRKKTVLLDLRNHYESRIGYFIDPTTGEKAFTPEIRRFAQWPLWVRRYVSGDGIIGMERGGDEETDERGDRQIMTYCTGGIRCEKGVRYLAESMSMRKGDTVCTLKGGIAAYLMWIEDEIKQGRKTPEDSLFRGKNYVFDGRGSTGLTAPITVEPVSDCVVCGKKEDRLSKCRSRSCHLILVVCEQCEKGDGVRCCEDCKGMDNMSLDEMPRPICQCERSREQRLWRSERPGSTRRQGGKMVGKQNKIEVKSTKINIQVKTIG